MKIFLCEVIDQGAYEKLDKNYTIISDINLISECHIIINRNITMDRDFIDQCKNCQHIIIHGTGYDDVDIEYAHKKGIHLYNTPGLNSLSVAELIIGQMINLSRKSYKLQEQYLKGNINELAPTNFIGNELSYKKVGFIGLGQISKDCLQILSAGFHMSICAYSPSLTQEKANQLNICFCESKEDVLKASDYIILGCSLNKQTYHMLKKADLLLMKKTAYIINCARGALIDQDALYDVLKNHMIAGAAIDVLEYEPIDYLDPLLHLDNIVYTPHIGGNTTDALKRIGEMIVCIVNDINKDIIPLNRLW